MKQIIKDVLDDMSTTQVNLGSDAARDTISNLISAALKTKGCYTEYANSEIEEQEARETWVCEICGENTFEVDYDYLGSGTNHLGCELEVEPEPLPGYVKNIAEDDGRDLNFLHGSEEIDGAYTPDEYEGWEKAVGYKEDDDLPEGLNRAKELSQQALDEGARSLQKQLYTEMTADGLPDGGDAQAVLESHKLADEIVDNQEGKWIYESPDGGETVFRRLFSDYDPENKEEIDWETKEPTGRKFTEYNNGNWRSKDEG